MATEEDEDGGEALTGVVCGRLLDFDAGGAVDDDGLFLPFLGALLPFTGILETALLLLTPPPLPLPPLEQGLELEGLGEPFAIEQTAVAVAGMVAASCARWAKRV